MFKVHIVLFCMIVCFGRDDIHSIYFSVINDMKFECINRECLILSNQSSRSFIHCQYLCLIEKRCSTTNYHQKNKECQLFNQILIGNNSLLFQMDIRTTILFKDTQPFQETSTWLNSETTLLTFPSISIEDTTEITKEFPINTPISMIDTSSQLTLSMDCQNTFIFPSGRSPSLGWYFEKNLIDYFGQYNGSSTSNNIRYSIGRNKCGKCLNFNYSLQEFVQIFNTPYIDLRNRSFSIESWIKPFVVGDHYEHVIFGQCPVKNTDMCMRTSISGTGYLSFLMYSDTLTGSRSIPINQWSHIVYVYDSTIKTMSLYLNGTVDISNGPHGPFLGIPSPLQIGNVALYNSANITFNGCIDDLWFYPFARTAQEINTTFALN